MHPLPTIKRERYLTLVFFLLVLFPFPPLEFFDLGLLVADLVPPPPPPPVLPLLLFDAVPLLLLPPPSSSASSASASFSSRCEAMSSPMIQSTSRKDFSLSLSDTSWGTAAEEEAAEAADVGDCCCCCRTGEDPPPAVAEVGIAEEELMDWLLINQRRLTFFWRPTVVVAAGGQTDTSAAPFIRGAKVTTDGPVFFVFAFCRLSTPPPSSLKEEYFSS